MIRVLYAEDDPQVAEVVQLAFHAYAGECVLEITGSGRDCLEAMKNEEIDVLLLDLVMPDMDGLHVLRELIARRDSRPIIMVSGQGQNELAVRAMRAGAVDCIDKNSSEFRRIPEIALRVHARHPRRKLPSPESTATAHSILFVDPDHAEQESFSVFLAASIPGLKVAHDSLSALEPLLRGDTQYDAVVLGANLNSNEMLATLRQLRANDEGMPVIVISNVNAAETTIAAFKLGAQDYLLRSPGCHAELVFSLNNALKLADNERLNAKLAGELARLNDSLAEEVTARTRDLENEIVVRREAERRSEENAARLQALSNRLLRVQEDERHAIARELHDQIGQLLTGLRFQLEAAREPGPNASVDNALTITDELLRGVRALTLQLRPRLLDDLGLRPALEWHAKVFQNQTGISVELELSVPEKRFDPKLEITAFRMVQEALTNVARHSGAGAATVTVTADDSALHVEISDRGCGFDASKAFERHDSLGLTGIAERVRTAGGRLELFSKPGHGTRVHAEFPLPADPASK